MTHKLAALRGRSLVPLLGQTDVPIAFVNDADAAALGEALAGAGQQARRSLTLTLGTGLGSGFVVDGDAVAEGPGVPPDGRLWCQPVEGTDRTVEEEVGRRALEACYVAHGGAPGVSVREIAARAAAGESAAQQVFAHLGARLAAGVAPSVRAFAPEVIILGGSIARSHALFAPLFRERLAALVGRAVHVALAQLGGDAPLVGAAAALRRRVARFARRRVIFLHGFASSPGAFKATRFAEALCRRGVALEVPALDEGDFRELTLTRQLALLERLTANAAEGSLLLVGSSMGAYVAALFAARSRRVAALVLMAPAFDFAQRWAALLGPDALARWERDGSMETMHHATGQLERIGWALMADARTHDAFPAVQVPTLVLHGQRDEVVPPASSARFAAERPNVERVLLDADHGMAEAIDEILARSIAFLAPWWT
jgi:pimeloyl-ACP methyl ester carboxylesterase